MADPERHLPLTGLQWDGDVVRKAIADIAFDTASATSEGGWPAHPLDEGADRSGGLYFGTSGIVWALGRLHSLGFGPGLSNPVSLLSAAERDCRDWLTRCPWPDYAAHGSLLVGDLGILLVRMRVAPNEAIADTIFQRCEANNALPLRELMWGTAGSMIASLRMLEMTGDQRFEHLYRHQAARLLGELGEGEDTSIWTQDLYRQNKRYLGAVHGFAGNMAPLIAGWDYITPDQRATCEKATSAMLQCYARQTGDGANWPANADRTSGEYLCQHCHGAPGIVTTLADAPFSSPDFDRLLTAGGIATWEAGPLAKGANLCHGTAGNGFAFLKLFKRTGSVEWLDKARAFAMTAIWQWSIDRARFKMGRYSLWTGDLGLALFLIACLTGDAQFPIIDML